MNEQQQQLPTAIINKYNDFVGRIFQRINDILKKNYDPVSVRLSHNYDSVKNQRNKTSLSTNQQKDTKTRFVQDIELFNSFCAYLKLTS